MSLKSDQVRQVALLARLALDEADIETYASELSSILELVEQLNQCDTAGVEPMAHPLDMAQRLREDVVTEPDQRDAFQSGAPEVRDGHYVVPRVIE